MLRGTDQRACINADGAAKHTCTRCARALCDRCAAFEINGTLFCEPCGNDVVEEAAPRYKLGLAVVAGGWLLISLAVAVEIALWQLYHSGIALFLAALCVGVAARLTWSSPGDRPNVRRRQVP